jgi:hypothetical protein
MDATNISRDRVKEGLDSQGNLRGPFEYHSFEGDRLFEQFLVVGINPENCASVVKEFQSKEKNGFSRIMQRLGDFMSSAASSTAQAVTDSFVPETYSVSVDELSENASTAPSDPGMLTPMSSMLSESFTHRGRYET